MLAWLISASLIVSGGWPFGTRAFGDPSHRRPAPVELDPASRAPLEGVRVDGPRLVDAVGNPVVLHGVDRMSTEYACIQGWGIFSGPSDTPGNAATLAAMADWHINAVRVPLNEDCWLDRETAGLTRQFVGDAYRAAIDAWVSQITGMGMVAVVDLHEAAPRGVQALTQQPMADADNAPDFWRSVAEDFKGNPLVVFDAFNEPYINRDVPDPADAWACWRDGCTVRVHEGPKQEPTQDQYRAAGMQDLVDAIRSTGATNPIMLGGLDYADDLSRLIDHLPSDPLGQLVASWHAYDGNNCGLEQPACWNTTIASVMATMPVVAGEFGRRDCTDQDLEPFMEWMDEHGGSYLAWVWTVVAEDTCPQQGGDGRYDLIGDYATGAPTPLYGEAVRAHYRQAEGEAES